MISTVCREISLLIQAWVTAALLFEFLPGALKRGKMVREGFIMIVFAGLHLKALSRGGAGVLCMTIMLIITMPFFSLTDRIRQISWALLVMVLNLLAEMGAVFLCRGIMREKMAVAANADSAVQIMEGMLLAVFVMAVYTGIDFRVRKIRYWELALLVAVPVYQLILLVSYFFICTAIREREIFLGCLLLILSIVIDNLLIRNINNLVQTEILQEEICRLYLQREGERNYQKLNENYEKQRRELEEKFAGQMERVNDMLESGEDLKKIRLSLDNAYQGIRLSKGVRYCDNAVVNSVLILKKKLAEEKRISMSIHTYITEETGIEALDLCSLFCNLIDNAIEACERITDPCMGRRIVIVSECKGGYLFLKVINNIDRPAKKLDGKYQTSKRSDAAEHGIGLQLVEKIVDFYEGKLQIVEEKEQFSVMAAIKMGQEKNDG